MQDRDILALETIVEFCDRMMDSVSEHGDDYETYLEDLEFQDACALRAIQIGENVNNLSKEFKEAHPGIPWHKIVAYRNIVAHDYGEIDHEIMWNTMKIDIPVLREFCAEQLK